MTRRSIATKLMRSPFDGSVKGAIDVNQGDVFYHLSKLKEKVDGIPPVNKTLTP